MSFYTKVFEQNPYPCFIFNHEGKILELNAQAKGFLADWNENSSLLTEKNLKILLYQNSMSIQNIEIYSKQKYFRFEVVEYEKDHYCFYGFNVTFQKNIAETLFNLIDDINEGLILVDIQNQGQIVEVNNTVGKFLGFDREELLTMSLKDIVYDFDLTTQDEWNAHVQNIKQESKSLELKHFLMAKDGKKISVEMVHSIKKIMEKDYQLTLIRDITKRLQAEKEKEQMKVNMIATAKLSHLGEMATSIAHEINNPLTIIVSNILSLKKMLDAQEINKVRATKSLETIDKTIQKITKVIGSLRTISKNIKNEAQVEENVIDVINDVKNIFSEVAKQQGIKLSFYDLDKINNLKIKCNRSQLSQVLISLVNNSYDSLAQKEGEKEIEIRVEESQNNLIISVTDNGEGIDPAYKDKIFEPFFSTKPLGKGAGLGLAIAQTTMKNHKGWLKVLKTGPEKTTIALGLPLK
jgi:PAS domain S-box-containing protein